MTAPAGLHVAAAARSASAYASHDDWLAGAGDFVQDRSAASWAFADWLAAGVAAFGREVLPAAAAATGASAGKISHYLAVATAYPELRRRKSLTFSHHLEVARLPEADADAILDAAATGGWSHRETRRAAREASVEGALAHVRASAAELQRKLEAALGDPRDTAAQARARLAAGGRLIREEAARTAGIVEELAQPGRLDALHGNARRGLAREARRYANRLATDVNATIDRIEAAAAEIEDGPAPAGEPGS